jgi:putative SOS response-associated peptidase YedK
MCGRYASARSVDDITGAFGISTGDVDEPLPDADWNVAPTKQVAAVVARDGRPALTALRWGLVPSWVASPAGGATQPGATLFNARLETVVDKPAFRDAIRRRRCLLPADGWYEWARFDDGRRIPHFLSAADGGLLALAGIWEEWRDAEGRVLRSTAILTGAAPPDLAHVHDRAPMVLERSAWSQWLDPGAPETVVRGLLQPTPSGTIRLWPVADRVGDVRENDSRLTTPVAVDEQPPLF